MARSGALLSVYLDTSIFVPLFVREIGTVNARALIARTPKPLLISSWTLTEFASALAAKVRLGSLTERQAAIARDRASAALAGAVFAEESVAATDFVAAANMLTPSLPPLRAGDALHLAICGRLGCDLATLDVALSAAAAAVGVRLTA